MTDYYLKNVDTYKSESIANRVAADIMFAVIRPNGYHFRVFELATSCDWVPEGQVWPAPFELTDEERKQLDEAQDRWVDSKLAQTDYVAEPESFNDGHLNSFYSRFALGTVIKRKGFEAKITGAGLDIHSGVFYTLSQQTHEGIRRHMVAEDELYGFEVVHE